MPNEHNSLRGFRSLTRRHILQGGSASLLAGASGILSRPALAAGSTVALVPKFTSDPYFVSADRGAQEAGKALGLTVHYNGPVDADVAGQVDIVDRLVRNGVAAISICALDPTALAPSLLRARRKGIKVNTWDADVTPDAREVFLNQASYAAIGEAIVDIMAKGAGTSGDFVMVTGSLTASNMLAWMKAIKDTIAKKYPGMVIKTTLLGEQDIQKGTDITLNYLRSHPATKGVFTVDGVAEVSVAEAVKQLGLSGKVTIAGIGVPNSIRPYIKSGVVKEAVLWSPVDIGYAAIYITKAQLDGTLDPAKGFVPAGRLGNLKFTAKDEVLLGPPLVFTQANIDNYHF
jgi:rhamnose transport system substrate-binding protein